jgi:hypothetical protein
MRNQARPGSAGGEHDLAHANRLGRKRDRRERGAFRSKEREVSAGVAAHDARDDVAVRGASTDLIIRIEEMVRETRLGIDDRAAGGARGAWRTNSGVPRCGAGIV